MPRLSKIRICGSKYEGFNKRHENSIFDLSPGNKGDHSLFTLKNGNGKGVILQLIFQLMLPGISWGSNNGNKLEGMFYDRYNVFKPYTFHVGLEWDLDGLDNKKLLSGICVSARWQKDTEDSDGKVGLKYFLYTHKYTGESRFSLKNLPLYSKSAGGVLDYDKLEAFIDENKQQFIKYYKSSVQSLNSDYYQYLASHGIYRSEWEIMKMINRSEGGLEQYFSRSKDNQALFDKLIIPAVSESINSRSGENDKSLLSMFVDNIKIARNLPELISRTEDINQLLQMVIPLLTDAEHGMKLKKSRQMTRERGNNYLHALKTRQSFLKNELDRSRDEKNKTSDIILELEYEEANLKYAGKLRELNRLKTEKSEYEKGFQGLQEGLLELKERKKLLQLNQHYLVYQGYQKDLQHTKERIDYLKEAAGLSNLRDAISKTKENIVKSWPELKERLEESSQDIAVYQNHLKSEEKSLKQEEQNLKINIRERELKIARYEEKKAKLAEKQEKLSARFNPLQLSTPSYLQEQIAAELEKENSKINHLIEEKAKKGENIESLKNKIAELKIELAHREDRYQEIECLSKERKSEEENIRLNLVKLLNLDKFKDVYNKDWLVEKRISLNKLLAEKTSRRGDLNNRRYELELDLSLNDKDFWIANYDQKRLYRMISDLDIKVYYGSDFLLNLVDQGEELIEKFPLLSYGLVLMYEADWEQIKKNLPEEELFRNAVPIYINHQLEKNEIEDSFKLVSGREKRFIFSVENYQEWYNSLSSQQEEITETTAAIDKKIEHIRRIDYSAERLLQEKSSQELAVELSKSKDEIVELESQIEENQKKLLQLQEERDFFQEKIIAAEARKDRLENDYRGIKDFAKESAELEEAGQEINRIREKLTVLEDKLSQNSNKRDENRNLYLKIGSEKENWLKDLRRFLLELDEIVPDVGFEEKDLAIEQQNYPVLYDYRDSRVNYFYQNLLDLEKKEDDKSAEIKYLREKQDSLKNMLLKEEDELYTLDPEWQEYTYDFKSEEELKVSLEPVCKQIAKQKEEISLFDRKINILTGEIKNSKKQTEELYHEINESFNKTARSWFDVDLKQKELEIKDSLEDCQKYLVELEDMIEGYNEKINSLSNLINKLELYQLDADKGEINKKLEELIKDNPFELVEQWINDYQEVSGKLKELKQKTEDDFYSFKRNINELIKNNILKIKIRERIIEDFRSDNYDFNYEMLSSFREYLYNELNRLDDNKAEAERARNQWAERSAMHVMRIITSLKEMINNMVFHNQRGYAFPLVRMRRSDFLPELEEEIIPELREYFVELIARFNTDGINIDRLSESQLIDYTGDAALFSRAVRGRYPVLQVYKMTEKNEFQYAKPQDYFYADWESVIQGKGDTPEASGGQSLSINAFMMMMLLNYKKQRLDKTNPWTVLFLDNPFGKASASHVLDPIFEIANKLNFQIIAFAAPEIIKSEISERFPVFYPLEIKTDEKGRGVVSVSGQVIYGERIRRT